MQCPFANETHSLPLNINILLLSHRSSSSRTFSQLTEEERINYLMTNHFWFVGALKLMNLVVVCFVLGFLITGVCDLFRKLVSEIGNYFKIKEYKSLILKKEKEIDEEQDQLEKYLEFRRRVADIERAQRS